MTDAAHSALVHCQPVSRPVVAGLLAELGCDLAATSNRPLGYGVWSVVMAGIAHAPPQPESEAAAAFWQRSGVTLGAPLAVKAASPASTHSR